ncbi:MAG: APC family permease [Anaerolineaceae bacterium]|nr:APC family permease [Anaerolineaceae bacterium]
MTIRDEHNGSSLQHRQAEYQPPKSIQAWFIGKPLATADAPHQTISKLVGLAVFSSDALSSTAYATQEMLVILIALGTMAYQYLTPLALVIVTLLVIITLSYLQTIHAYPTGGGAYIVSRDNLGWLPAQITAAALLSDYILTVAVSVSSGVAQIVSAYPILYEYRVILSVALVFFVMMINLRGVKESGMAFAIPTYFFILMMYATVIVGLFRYFSGSLGVLSDPPHYESMLGIQAVSVLLILRAFSNGTAALTGVEAISDGIPAFKEPKSKNAGQTLLIMAAILGSLMISISFLAAQIQAVPADTETVISQLARTIFGGRGILYLGTLLTTTVILILAANTSFADFPRLSAIAAGDGFLPRQMTYRGSRLVYSYGIVALAMFASLLLIIFQASVTNLIPLYAIGVFVSFTFSQTGMARRWWRIGKLKPGEELKQQGSTLRPDKTWRVKIFINSLGAVLTVVVVVIFSIFKFKDGAWVVLVLIPALVIVFSSIHRHYQHVAKLLTLDDFGSVPHMQRHRVILPIGGVHRGTLTALRYASSLSDDVTAVHISIDPVETEKIREKWDVWGEGVRLVIIDSPYRLFIEPLLNYVEEIDQQRQANELITIVVPQFVTHNRLAGFLHTRTADTLRKVLIFQKDIVITDVPYQVD